MNFPKANSFDSSLVASTIMGPNPLKMCEELLVDAPEPAGSIVCDLACGCGITSVMLAKHFGFTTYAVDLWNEAETNQEFFASQGLTTDQIVAVKADASQGLPFSEGFFDAVVCIDSYNYFGRDPRYLGEKLLPYVKRGGCIYLAIAGMVQDCHDDLPECLTVSWTPDQMDYMHDMSWWKAMFDQTPEAEVVSMHPMSCTQECWADWVECDNDYARGDKRAVEAGALDYLNTIAVVLRRR